MTRQYPGERLRNAVDAVLAELTVTGSPDRELLDHFEETLRAGLAWTAATGDTCRFGRAVTAVREAQLALDGSDPEQAIAALRSAREGLRLTVVRGGLLRNRV